MKKRKHARNVMLLLLGAVIVVNEYIIWIYIHLNCLILPTYIHIYNHQLRMRRRIPARHLLPRRDPQQQRRRTALARRHEQRLHLLLTHQQIRKLRRLRL